MARIRFADGPPLTVKTASATLVPGPVHIALRPETITVCDAASEAALLRGTVRDATYFGAGSQMLVCLDDGTEIQAQVDRPSPVGTVVGLSCDTSMLQVLAD